jgi:Bifunctional DNA primase/polymerase, N-terminal
VTPYRTGAPLYLQAGWAGVIPLPPKKKSAPPSGYTGWNGKDPSAKMVETWCNETVGDYQAASNIAIHPPDGVVGVDVDHYGGKAGGDTFTQLEAELGELPPTYKSTSRDDVSGILWYRVEPGLRWPTGPGKDIEFIQRPPLRGRVAVDPSRHWQQVHLDRPTRRQRVLAARRRPVGVDAR